MSMARSQMPVRLSMDACCLDYFSMKPHSHLYKCSLLISPLCISCSISVMVVTQSPKTSSLTPWPSIKLVVFSIMTQRKMSFFILFLNRSILVEVVKLQVNAFMRCTSPNKTQCFCSGNTSVTIMVSSFYFFTESIIIFPSYPGQKRETIIFNWLFTGDYHRYYVISPASRIKPNVQLIGRSILSFNQLNYSIYHWLKPSFSSYLSQAYSFNYSTSIYYYSIVFLCLFYTFVPSTIVFGLGLLLPAQFVVWMLSKLFYGLGLIALIES